MHVRLKQKSNDMIQTATYSLALSMPRTKRAEIQTHGGTTKANVKKPTHKQSTWTLSCDIIHTRARTRTHAFYHDF